MAASIRNDQPFSRTATMALIGIGVSAFFGAIIIYVFADLFNPQAQVGANFYSDSAIGHAAAVELLQDLDLNIFVSRRDPTLDEAATGKEDRRDQEMSYGAGDVLVMAEPIYRHLDDEFIATASIGRVVLLILPKRFGIRSQIQPRWIEIEGVASTNLPQNILQLFVDSGEILRPEEPQTWQSHALPGLIPELVEPQLFQADNVTPLIESDDGILLGRIDGTDTTLYVLSDPDLMSNHGLGDGNNAVIFVNLMEEIAGTGTIRWDETRHGFAISETLWRGAFEPPFLPISLTVVFAAIILLLVTTYRFGSPLPAPEVRSRGKSALVGALADLLSLQKHHGELMRRYLTYGLRDAVMRMNAPSRMSELQAIHWIVDIGVTRGMSRDQAETPLLIFEALQGQKQIKDPGRLTRLVKNFYDWKMELLDGSR